MKRKTSSEKFISSVKPPKERLELKISEQKWKLKKINGRTMWF
jgi:hypothetical protein